MDSLGGEKKSKSKKKKSKSGGSSKKLRAMHIRKARSGGFIAQHEHEPSDDGAPTPSDEHVVPDLKALQEHIGDHFQDGEEADEAEQPSGPGPGGMPSAAGMPA